MSIGQPAAEIRFALRQLLFALRRLLFALHPRLFALCRLLFALRRPVKEAGFSQIASDWRFFSAASKNLS